jgi:hypothetical protein
MEVSETERIRSKRNAPHINVGHTEPRLASLLRGGRTIRPQPARGLQDYTLYTFVFPNSFLGFLMFPLFSFTSAFISSRFYPCSGLFLCFSLHACFSKQESVSVSLLYYEYIMNYELQWIMNIMNILWIMNCRELISKYVIEWHSLKFKEMHEYIFKFVI